MELPDNPNLPVLSEIKSALQADPAVFGDYIVAHREEEFVGICTLAPAGDAFYNEVTGVSPEYRNQGIATGLFIKAIELARANFLSRIRNDVLDRNKSMLVVMKKLGFLQEYANILFQKKFHEN